MHLHYGLQLLLVFKHNAGAGVTVFGELSVPIYLQCLLSVLKHTQKKKKKFFENNQFWFEMNKV